MNKGDAVIYVCVIIGAGVGLYLGNAIPGVLIGLGVGYLIKEGIKPNNNR
ncbi:molecular chaperone DnaJ [Paenibacillus sp. DMB20]|nr:molecular chaperone DnaJ [Paenibacillus sp. DMB20]